MEGSNKTHTVRTRDERTLYCPENQFWAMECLLPDLNEESGFRVLLPCNAVVVRAVTAFASLPRVRRRRSPSISLTLLTTQVRSSYLISLTQIFEIWSNVVKLKPVHSLHKTLCCVSLRQRQRSARPPATLRHWYGYERSGIRFCTGTEKVFSSNLLISTFKTRGYKTKAAAD